MYKTASKGSQGAPRADARAPRASRTGSELSLLAAARASFWQYALPPEVDEGLRAGVRWARPWCSRVVGRVDFQVLMFMVTVYALVGDDIRLASTERSADVAFNCATMVAFLLFSFELGASCIGKEDYFMSFFFYLEIIATASLILDITWVYSELILGDSGTSVVRMSRVGPRAGRVVRVIRLVRLIRIIKMYKHYYHVWRRLRGVAGEEGARPGEGAEVYAESRVGQKLSHMTTQKVILLILFMLIVLPTISVEEYFRDVPTSTEYGANAVQRAYSTCLAFGGAEAGGAGAFNASGELACRSFEQQLTMFIGYHHRQRFSGCDTGWNQAFGAVCRLDLGWIGFRNSEAFEGFEQRPIEQHWSQLFSDVSFAPSALEEELSQRLNAGSRRSCGESKLESLSDFEYTSLFTDASLECPHALRYEERSYIMPEPIGAEEPASLLFVFDLRPWTLRSAVCNILTTCFICFIFAVGAMVFSHDANVLVLQPIERMIAKVMMIRDNPLYAMRLGDESYRQKQEQENGDGAAGEDPQDGSRRGLRKRCACWRRQDVKVQTLETKILENAIIKLGKLLALGFGEAGSEIIGKNMDDDSATVNAMIPGNMVEAVFGFCNLRNFADTTEVLQDKVMVFVNQVAEIVHSIVDTWHGTANRNIGSAFLIVWRMRAGFSEELRSKVGDMSVISFVQVVAAINKSAVLKDYREHPALIARLPKYRVRMGFGLHYGWAIEGAIGSEFKIDASYLSPHVNMASRLEAVTQHYQVAILLSEPLARLCSAPMASHFRAIDCVTPKGVSAPIRLHTVDLQAESLKVDRHVPRTDKNQFELRMQRERAKEERLQDSFKVPMLFETDPDLRQMRKDLPKKFFQLFNKGYVNYEAGEWGVARAVFEKTSGMLPGHTDGPSQALLSFMSLSDFESSSATPKGWPGYRELAQL